MFDYIKGQLTSKSKNFKANCFTVENSGIGYLLEVSDTDYDKKNINDEIKIYTVLIHKEDSMSLCGFLCKEARDIFNVLTSVSGIGSKMALGLLGEFDVSDLIYAVVNENAKELTKAKGVGIKLAQKIILELKDKFISFGSNINIDSNIQISSDAEDIQNILVSLGYEQNEINKAINKVLEQGVKLSDNEEFLRKALQYLSA
ncbi:Holliday junction branch migration protein RuvA [bacterium]|nr:Holliday junction branch migration protein RuvA [bacterium]